MASTSCCITKKNYGNAIITHTHIQCTWQQSTERFFLSYSLCILLLFLLVFTCAYSLLLQPMFGLFGFLSHNLLLSVLSISSYRAAKYQRKFLWNDHKLHLICNKVSETTTQWKIRSRKTPAPERDFWEVQKEGKRA